LEVTAMTRIACTGSDGPKADRRARVERLLRELDAILTEEYNDDEDPGTIDDIEDESDRVAESVRKIVADKLLKKKQRNAQGQSGARRWTCICGQPARYAGMRPRLLVLRSGAHTLVRAYFHCSVCHQGHCPLDGLLKLGPGQYSPPVAALMARLNTYLPDRQAVEELRRLLGIEPSVSTLQRYSRRAGSKIASEWQEQQEQWRSQTLPESAEHPKRLTLSMDGVKLHVDGEWREAKIAVAYSYEGDRGVHSRFTATMETSAEFGKRLPVLAHRAGVDHCRDVSVVADGGPWIWQETARYFPTSVQILDFYHASQHLWAAARARYGEGTGEAKTWATTLTTLMFEEKQAQLRKEIRIWQPRTKEKQTIRRRLLAYLLEHTNRIAYCTLKEKGYHIGSGAVEAACKNVVQSRMKRAGMRWSSTGAEAMLHASSYFHSHGQVGFRQYV
jgi:hypothetical protein